MLKTLEKTWPFVSLLLALTLLVASFSYPLLARPLGQAVMALGLLARWAWGRLTGAAPRPARLPAASG